MFCHRGASPSGKVTSVHTLHVQLRLGYVCDVEIDGVILCPAVELLKCIIIDYRFFTEEVRVDVFFSEQPL